MSINFIIVNEDDANECIHIVEQIRADIYLVLELIASQNEKARGKLVRLRHFQAVIRTDRGISYDFKREQKNRYSQLLFRLVYQ